MVNYHVEAFEAYLAEEERAQFVGLRSAELQYTALGVVRDYEEEIRVLYERIRAVKSVYNSGACINELLPNELLVQIFREAGRTKPIAALRLTHVCRSWRSLIHGTPVFWVDVLNPSEDTLARGERDLSVVKMAFRNSKPVPKLRFSLTGAFLSSMTTLSDHLARISTLSLDCTGKKSRDIHALFALRLPQLEDLSVWLRCREALVPADLSLPFPRLRRLHTNCATSAVRWVKPTLHSLIIGPLRTEWGQKGSYEPCCRLRDIDRLWNAVRDCSDLIELRLGNCIGDAVLRPRNLRLNLSSLQILDLTAQEADTVHTLLECMTFPATTQVMLASHCRYHKMDAMQPGSGVPCLRDIDAIAIDMGRILSPVYGYVVRGWKLDDKGRREKLLARFGSSASPPSVPFNPIDLHRFFQGATSKFLPHMISDLKFVCVQAFPSDNGGWLWLFQHLPRIISLEVKTPSSADLCAALSQKDVLPNLRIFRLTTTDDKTAVDDNSLVDVLEERASRALHLDKLRFLRHVTGFPQQEVASDLLKRLRSILPDRFSFSYKLPSDHEAGREPIPLRNIALRYV